MAADQPTQRGRPLTIIRAGDGDPRHGTLNGYCNLRCRCAECRAVWASYCVHRRSQRTLVPGDPRHGTASAYINYSCKCRACKEGYNAYRRDLRRRRRALTTGTT